MIQRLSKSKYLKMSCFLEINIFFRIMLIRLNLLLSHFFLIFQISLLLLSCNLNLLILCMKGIGYKVTLHQSPQTLISILHWIQLVHFLKIHLSFFACQLAPCAPLIVWVLFIPPYLPCPLMLIFLTLICERCGLIVGDRLCKRTLMHSGIITPGILCHVLLQLHPLGLLYQIEARWFSGLL